METQKKKKIFDILKKIGISIIIIVGIIILINNCTKKTKALSTYDNYNYQYVIYIDTKTDYDANYYKIEGDVIGYWNTEWKQGDDNILDNYDWYMQKSLDVSDGLSISVANVTTKDSYLVKGVINNGRYNIYSVTTWEIYIDVLTTDTYYGGYETASDTSDPTSAYNQGVSKGKQQQAIEDNKTLQQTVESYNSQIETLNQQLQDAINNNGANNWVSFKNLLGLIFMYPIRFLKEGMNVNIWGVNIGGLILGLLMIGITVSIIGMFLGKKVN